MLDFMRMWNLTYSALKKYRDTKHAARRRTNRGDTNCQAKLPGPGCGHDPVGVGRVNGADTSRVAALRDTPVNNAPHPGLQNAWKGSTLRLIQACRISLFILVPPRPLGQRAFSWICFLELSRISLPHGDVPQNFYFGCHTTLKMPHSDHFCQKVRQFEISLSA